MANDPVNHPDHYTDGGYEVIDFIEDRGFSYHLGNAVKYISRAGKKSPSKKIEDLEKAAWYLERAKPLKPQPPQKTIPLREYAAGKHLDFNLVYALACLDEGEVPIAADYVRRQISLEKAGSANG